MERTPLFMNLNNVYSGDELALPYRDLVSEGIVGAGSLEVTQTGTPGLSVNIAAGAAWVEGDTSPDFQPTYRVFNDAVVNKGISPDPSLPRKVLVVAQINDETFAGSGWNWQIVALHGDPNASPVLPDLPDSAIPLAEIDVTAGATSIVTADITDVREPASIGGAISPSGGAGEELAYVEFTSDVTVDNTNEASPDDVVSSGAVTYEAEKVCIEFFAWNVNIGTATFVQFNLWVGSTDLGHIAIARGTGAEETILARRYLTPSAGSHTYRIRAIVNTGSGTVNAGAGGVAADLPGFIRVTRA
jgi:hypothetical protein